MADVAQKAINANDVTLGNAVVKTGIKQFKVLDTTPQTKTLPTIAQVEAKYTDRLDDKSYYNT